MAQIIMWAAIGYLVSMYLTRPKKEQPKVEVPKVADPTVSALIVAVNNHQVALMEFAKQLSVHGQAIEYLSNGDEIDVVSDTRH